MWIRHIALFMPQEASGQRPASKGVLVSVMAPFDGTNMLATGEKKVNIRDLTSEALAANQDLADLLSVLTTELARVATNDSGLLTCNINASYPDRPVAVQAFFKNGKGYTLGNMFALAAEDTTFAAAISTVMAKLAALAGLPVA